MKEYLLYWGRMVKEALTGSRQYYLWLLFLLCFVSVGVGCYAYQMSKGFIVTNLDDNIPWGAYIANFTYIVGLAAAAVMLVIPAYVYKMDEVKEVMVIGELFAVASIVMCLLFVTVDIGRPERFWHLIPYVGKLNFPQSLLAWDVIVLNGYLLLNLHIPGYSLWQKYRGLKPKKIFYLPFVFLSMFWAISIHTVTAFLYSGLGGRPFWNSAIVAPRFLASAFAVGPCFILIVLQLVEKFSSFHVSQEVYRLLKRIIAVTMILNLFLLGCEVFKEFYTDSLHTASATYLFFGLEGRHMLVPYIWTAIVFNIIATIIFATNLSRSMRLVNTACVLAIVGIWIEKGMGLIIPGFIPSPLGQISEYAPSLVEIGVCAGIWATGALVLTLLLKAALPIETGQLRINSSTQSP